MMELFPVRASWRAELSREARVRLEWMDLDRRTEKVARTCRRIVAWRRQI